MTVPPPKKTSSQPLLHFCSFNYKEIFSASREIAYIHQRNLFHFVPLLLTACPWKNMDIFLSVLNTIVNSFHVMLPICILCI